MVPLNLALDLPLFHFEFSSMSLNNWAKRSNHVVLGNIYLLPGRHRVAATE